MSKRVSAFALVAIVACLLGGLLESRALFATWLAAWWFAMGVAMGGLANVWLHTLTGGEWGEAIRDDCLAMGRCVPLLAVLFIPVLLGAQHLYPWMQDGERWVGELSSPDFKRAWLSPAFFIVRSVCYLVLWCVLAWLSGRRARSQRFAVLALILYGFSASLAAVDWLMSLMPLWYSSVFGLLVVTTQMLAGLAAVIVLAAGRRTPPAAHLCGDLANLLLMYVLTWAYLAFTQYLIIWAADLPHEISWYVQRVDGAWRAVGVLLILFHFFIPLVLLLMRAVKRNPQRLRTTAAMLLAAHLVDVWWLVLPSIADVSVHVWWLAPLTVIALGAMLYAWFVHPPERREVAHG